MRISKPKVAVIVPVFNGARSVTASVESLLTQTLREIEVVAVNDASTDDSGNILDRLARDDRRLKVIHLLKNGGVHEARAAGLRASTAPWIGFLDADDFARPEMFQALHKACEATDADISVCGVDRVSSDRRFLSKKVSFERHEVFTEECFPKFCQGRFGSSLWNKLYRREIILDACLHSFRWRQNDSEDILVNLGCFMRAAKVQVVPDVLYEYVLNESSATETFDTATAYCGVIRAFALAVDRYGDCGAPVLGEITRLYGRYLADDCYCVARQEDLIAHERAFAEALHLLADKHPLGLAALIKGPRAARRKEESFREAVGEAVRVVKRLPKLFFAALRRR
jgi:glycosyltransferase involved in cell wall biosynthesis